MEKSCGAVVYARINDEVQYILIKDKHGNFGFPKGHVENNETEEETTLREILEETGVNAEILPNYRKVYEYTMPNGILKQVVYFIAEFNNETAKIIPEENCEVFLMKLTNALVNLTFDNMKELIKEVNDYINK